MKCTKRSKNSLLSLSPPVFFLFIDDCRLWKPTWHRRTVTGSMPMRWGQTQTPTVYSPHWMLCVSLPLSTEMLMCCQGTHQLMKPIALSLGIISHSLTLAAHHLFSFYLGCLWDCIFIWCCVIALPFCVDVIASFSVPMPATLTLTQMVF